MGASQEALRAEFEAELRRLTATWFPRCVDRQHGGFLCDFDRRWKPAGGQLKLLEHQARQTRAAARCALDAPDLAPLRAAAEHGFRYLKDRMWDASRGGWYRPKATMWKDASHEIDALLDGLAMLDDRDR